MRNGFPDNTLTMIVVIWIPTTTPVPQNGMWPESAN